VLFSVIIIVLTSLFSYGCATIDKNVTYKEKISRGTAEDVSHVVQMILHRRSYTIIRSEVSLNQIYYETNWSLRLPYESEQNEGFSDVRTKIILKGRPHMRVEYGQERLFNIEFIGETQYKLKGEDVWLENHDNTEARGFLKEIAYEMNTELSKRLYSQ